jgi:predicted acylesterase/phospholipase RssA
MAKRLAITIAGAVSLGAYEAGVLYEILEALRQHNNHSDTIARGDQIYIDVLTGASAGGMTAVIAAQKLLYEGNSLHAPESNPFFNPWVADISLDRLLHLSSDETQHKTGYSIFSSDLIETLGTRYILQRYANGQPGTRQRHAAAAEKISLGLALSNLNGVSYSYEIRTRQGKPDATFSYGRFQDEKVGVFAANGGDGRDDSEAWQPWKEAAVSCGAFPFAFRVKELRRDKDEYTRHHLDPWEPPPHRDFAYTDGGVFQNEPLGLAKNLVDQIDRPAAGAFQDSDSRFYLYVAPGAKTSDVNVMFKAAAATLLPTAKALVGAILHQARFQDWINAEKINSQINVFNIRAEQLFQALRQNTIDPAVLQRAADELLPGLFQTNPPPAKGVRDDSIDDARTRLRQQFAKESAELLQAGPAIEQAWIDSILVLETAAELNLKDEMNIYGITAKNTELAGGGLFAFEGFFDLTLRKHDYNLGRQKAQAFLDEHLTAAPQRLAGNVQPPPDIGPIRCTLTSVESIKVPARDPQTGDVLISQLDLNVRQKLYETVSARAEVLLVELKVPWLVRKGIKAFFVNPQLKRRLGL